MRQQVASLRGELALQQIQQLDEHDNLLGDYQHLLAVYLNPGKYVDVAGLDPGEATARLEAIRQQASRLVLPTERDTLAGALQMLSKALIASFTAKRTAAGITPRQMHGRRPQRDAQEPEAPTPPDLTTLDPATLRSVTTAIAALSGAGRHHGEPPKPPPPEGLDDLVGAARGIPPDP